jgi:hypothetical protein
MPRGCPGSVVFLVLASVAAACSAGRTAGARAELESAPEALQAKKRDLPFEISRGSMCPVTLPGTKVELQSTDSGVAMVFTNRGDRLRELRERVRSMTKLHNDMMRAHSGAGGSESEAHSAAMQPFSQAVAEDVEGGGRMVLTPADPADIGALRAHAASKVQRMRQTGACADLDGGPKHWL